MYSFINVLISFTKLQKIGHYFIFAICVDTRSIYNMEQNTKLIKYELSGITNHLISVHAIFYYHYFYPSECGWCTVSGLFVLCLYVAVWLSQKNKSVWTLHTCYNLLIEYILCELYLCLWLLRLIQDYYDICECNFIIKIKKIKKLAIKNLQEWSFCKEAARFIFQFIYS